MVVFTANDKSDLLQNLGDFGRKEDARPKRTKDQKEAYCLRRYLLTLAGANLLRFPLCVEKSKTPDFVVSGSELFGIEVTEATDEVDQREYSLAAKSDEKTWFDGQFGGRGTFVGDSHERYWLTYVKRAIGKKQNLKYSTVQTKLLIYSNSNASGHIEDDQALALIKADKLDPYYFSEISILRPDSLIICVAEKDPCLLPVII